MAKAQKQWKDATGKPVSLFGLPVFVDEDEAAPMSIYYKLVGKRPVECSFDEFAEWSRGIGNKHIMQSSEIGGVMVSTVFLGLDHSWKGPPPILFETKIFGGKHDEYQERCATWEEAEEMHKRAFNLAFGIGDSHGDRSVEA